MAAKPTWQYYHALGEELATSLDANCTYAEIAAELGVSNQRAWHECMVALGKLAHGLKKQLGGRTGQRVHI